MAFAKKKSSPDPISDRARSLNDEIAALEAEIKRLDSQLHTPEAKPKLRSTTSPQGVTVQRKPEPESPAPAAPAIPPAPAPIATPPPALKSKPNPFIPVFEDVKSKSAERVETSAADQYNQLGVRKYDLPALINRIRTHFRGPTTTNPRLVNYLAAGGVHGLRPLRYEKRVARNRFIVFTAILFLILLGIILTIARHR